MTNLDILSYAENGIAMRIKELDKFSDNESIAKTIKKLKHDREVIQLKIAELFKDSSKIVTVFDSEE